MTKNQTKILIVDDEQVVVDSLIKICSLKGFDGTPAYNAEEGLSLLNKEKFDLILCDIMLPELNGFEFMDELQSRKIETPVIMMTGYSTVENAVKALNQGAIDYIPKPFTVDEVLSVLHRSVNYIDIKRKVKDAHSTDIVFVGATDLYLKTLDEFDLLQLKEIDEIIYQGTSCAKFIKDEEHVHDLLSPISGKIIERNEEILSNTNIVEKDPFFKGWLYRVIPSDIEYELKNLASCSSDQI
jgi:YesN/AraC family two-component response regulator